MRLLNKLLLIMMMILFIRGFLRSEPLSLTIHAEAAILINAETGQILYEKNAHALHYPASTTKIVTALYALNKKGSQLDSKVIADQEAIASISWEAKRRSNYTLPSHWIEQGSTHIGIKKGEEFTFKDLLYGMMLASGNDASNVIAQYVGGTIDHFMIELNAYVKSLGCQNTTFYNPHGLHHPKHISTAYDLALITKEALKNPIFSQIVKTVRYTRPKTNKQESTTFVQSNRLLRQGRHYYSHATGVKTGYTSLALNTLVASAKKDNRTLIAVLFKAKERQDIFADAIQLFEAAFNQPKIKQVLLKGGIQKFTREISGSDRFLKTYILEDFSIEYYPAEKPKIRCLLYWDDLSIPIAKDQRVGELRLENNGITISTIPLYAQEEITFTCWSWLKQLIN